MKRLGVVLVGGMMALAQGTALSQPGKTSADECVTCARWRSYQQVDIRRYERGFLGSLQHNVDGVVESAIREVALIKMAQPGWESGRMVSALHRLATGSREPAIRVKATLAEAVFTENLTFIDESYRTDEEVFGAIVRQMHRQRFAASETSDVKTIAHRVGE